jgi:hypothetical protein
MPSMAVSMKFIVEIPDLEVFEAAEQPEDLACEVGELIASEIFGFSSVTVIPQQWPVGIHRVIQPRIRDSRIMGRKESAGKNDVLERRVECSSHGGEAAVAIFSRVWFSFCS